MSASAGEAEAIRVLPCGEQHILIELGRCGGLQMSLRTLRLAGLLEDAALPGMVDIVPMFASVLLGFDPLTADAEAIERECRALIPAIGDDAALSHVSRLIEIPVCYGDPWTAACVDDYRAKVAPIEHNPTYVARANGMSDCDQVYQRHSSTEHWVAGVGFWPGLPDMFPLDPECRLFVPKYDPPRIWTVPGGVGVGGGFTSIYPLETPGGYHLIGRTPTPIYGLNRTHQAGFDGSVVLFRPGDRVRFRRIDVDEFTDIEAEVSNGDYEHVVVEEETFDLRRYHRQYGAAA
ncbi:5-oxoprolinase subunit B family protein [Mycolicibacterium sp. 050158]|uniref:5-oxoprolinase subunit B family protein n=1 Tax=Mycolicibacterium sp. 050158 TaxID=3090602 RepID=UPI00299F4DAE|nr:carboxyltransferase domain-containing protein [Mycolicibacterium sp. 050158]MDX1888019.1 carboxyltransferase domain-containing protein [Mycolicibacterium sp. 050158]